MNQTLGVHKPWKLTYHTYGKLGWMVNIWFNERMIHIIVILPQGTTTQALWYIPITSWSETIRISIYTPYFVYTCTLVLFFLFQKVFYINLGCLFHFDRCLLQRISGCSKSQSDQSPRAINITENWVAFAWQLWNECIVKYVAFGMERGHFRVDCQFQPLGSASIQLHCQGRWCLHFERSPQAVIPCRHWNLRPNLPSSCSIIADSFPESCSTFLHPYGKDLTVLLTIFLR